MISWHVRISKIHVYLKYDREHILWLENFRTLAVRENKLFRKFSLKDAGFHCTSLPIRHKTQNNQSILHTIILNVILLYMYGLLVTGYPATGQWCVLDPKWASPLYVYGKWPYFLSVWTHEIWPLIHHNYVFTTFWNLEIMLL